MSEHTNTRKHVSEHCWSSVCVNEGDCEYFSSSSFYSTILIFQICNAISMFEHASTRKLICVFAHFADLAQLDQSLFLTFRGNRGKKIYAQLMMHLKKKK